MAEIKICVCVCCCGWFVALFCIIRMVWNYRRTYKIYSHFELPRSVYLSASTDTLAEHSIVFVPFSHSLGRIYDEYSCSVHHSEILL